MIIRERAYKEYFMYGICLPYIWWQEWETRTGKDFQQTFYDVMHDDVFTADDNKHYQIHCLFNGKNGKHMIIGRTIECIDDYKKLETAIPVPELNTFEITYIKDLIKKHFELEGDYYYYFIKGKG